jgi:circadian clock protein KaiC
MTKKVNSTKSDNREEFERIPSGIPGLDKLIEGGFVKGSTVLVSGSTGTGKTIFCVQYLLEGLKKGETCIFITLEESPDDIIGDVRRFGWDLEKYVNEKKLFLSYKDPFQMIDIVSPLLDEIKEKKIQRVVIDSTALFEMYYKDPSDIRKQLFKLLSGLKNIGATSLLTSELPEESKMLGKFGVEEFIVDGVILLKSLGLTGEIARSLRVVKMRRTKHDEDIYSIDITSKGIKILPIQRGIKI